MILTLPTHGAKNYNVSEFGLVKSADITYTRARKKLMNVDDLREINHKTKSKKGD